MAPSTVPPREAARRALAALDAARAVAADALHGLRPELAALAGIRADVAAGVELIPDGVFAGTEASAELVRVAEAAARVAHALPLAPGGDGGRAKSGKSGFVRGGSGSGLTRSFVGDAEFYGDCGEGGEAEAGRRRGRQRSGKVRDGWADREDGPGGGRRGTLLGRTREALGGRRGSLRGSMSFRGSMSLRSFRSKVGSSVASGESGRTGVSDGWWRRGGGSGGEGEGTAAQFSAACKRLEELGREVRIAVGQLRHERSNFGGVGVGGGRVAVVGVGVGSPWSVRPFGFGGRSVVVAGAPEDILKLGQVVLDAKPRQVVAAAGRYGNGRVAACHLVSTSKAASARFLDGTIWVRGWASGDGGYAAALRCVCSALEGSGMLEAEVEAVLGRCVSGESGHAGFMQLALDGIVAVAQERFAGRRVMLILESDSGSVAGPGDPADLVALFQRVLERAAPAAVLVVCTEFAAVTRCADAAVVFPDSVAEPETVRQMFRLHAEVPGPCADDYLADLGGGAPLAVALVGRVARVAPATAKAVLIQTLPEEMLAVAEHIASSCNLPLHLTHLLSRVLDMLDARLLNFDAVLPSTSASPESLPYSWSAMYLALAIVEPDAPLSILLLRRLWKLASNEVVYSVVDVFAFLGLATFERDQLHMHQTHLLYCRGRNACDSSVASTAVWHLRILTQLALCPALVPDGGSDATGMANLLRKRSIAARNTSRLLDVPKDVCSISEGGPLCNIPWWRLCVSGDLDAEYHAANLVRHLVSAAGGGLGGAVALLADYRYIDFKCTATGVDSVKRDYHALLAAALRAKSTVGQDGDPASLDSLCTEVQLVLQSLDLMPEAVTGSGKARWRGVFGMMTVEHGAGEGVGREGGGPCADQGLANQLIGRLPKFSPGSDMRRISGRVNLTSRLRQSVVEHARRPWLRPLTEHLEQAGGGLERVIRLGTGTITAVAVSGDGALVVSGTVSGSICIHDLRTGRALSELRGHHAQVHSVSVSDDVPRRVVSSSWDNSVRIWDAETGKCLFVLSEHTDQVFCTATTASGSCVASGSMDKMVMVWRNGLAVGSSMHILDGHADWVRAVALSSDGALVFSGSDDTTVRVWTADPYDSTMMCCWHVLRGHRSRVTCLAVTADDKNLISGSFDGTIRVWCIETGSVARVFAGLKGKRVISVAAPKGSGTVVAGYDDGVTRVWQLQGHTRRPLAEFGAGLMAGGVCVTRDGSKAVSSSVDGALRVWSPPKTSRNARRNVKEYVSAATPLVRSQDLHSRPVSAITASRDGLLVASGSWDKEVRVWRVASGRCEMVLAGHAHAISSLTFTDDGRMLVSGCRDDSVKLWSVHGGNCERTLYGHRAAVTAVAVDHDGSRIVSGCERGSVMVWSVGNEYAQEKPLRRFSAAVISVAMSFNGSIAVALSASGTCILWDVSGGLAGEPMCLSSVKFANFRFGPSTAAATLAAYSTKCSLPVSAADDGTSTISTGPTAGYKCSPTARGPGLAVSWARKCGDGTSSSDSDQAEEAAAIAGKQEKCGANGKTTAEHNDAPNPSTVAYLDSGMGRAQRAWTPVFSAQSGQKFVAAGLCTGAVAIMELVE